MNFILQIVKICKIYLTFNILRFKEMKGNMTVHCLTTNQLCQQQIHICNKWMSKGEMDNLG
jgi:hypothetical protein